MPPSPSSPADVCREAASCELEGGDLAAAHLDFVNAESFSSHAHLYRPLKEAVEKLMAWLNDKVSETLIHPAPYMLEYRVHRLSFLVVNRTCPGCSRTPTRSKPLTGRHIPYHVADLRRDEVYRI